MLFVELLGHGLCSRISFLTFFMTQLLHTVFVFLALLFMCLGCALYHSEMAPGSNAMLQNVKAHLPMILCCQLLCCFATFLYFFVMHSFQLCQLLLMSMCGILALP